MNVVLFGDGKLLGTNPLPPLVILPTPGTVGTSITSILEGQGDLVSILTTLISNVVTPFIPIASY